MDSLNVDNIRDHLLKYHKDNYSSNLMSLCVVGNHEVEDLEKFVRNHFSNIEDKKIKLKDYSKDPMYDNTSLGKILKYVPLKESRLLTIKWPNLPPVRDYWDGNPLMYLANTLGDEGENSLLSELIRQDLAVTVMCGPQYRMQD